MSNTIKTYSDKLVTRRSELANAKANHSTGMLATFEKINMELQGIKSSYENISHKKALKASKDKIFAEFKTTKLNKKGVEIEVFDVSTDLKRTFNVAFTMLFRKMEIKTSLLTLTQIENLTAYGTVNGVNDLMAFEGEMYIEKVVAYLKSLKTRTVTSKTFEKKVKLS